MTATAQHVLVVEDDADIRQTLVELLDEAGYVVAAISDGKPALTRLHTSKERLVVLLDLKLPRVDGIEVLTRMRADPRTKLVPVVVLTSSREDPDISRCYALGVNSYIVKPVAFEEFIKVVSSLGLYWLLLNQPPT